MAIPNIIGIINQTEPFASLSTEIKQSLLDNFCEARGYQETVINEQGETVANPQSKTTFANIDILKNYILMLATNNNIKKVKEELVINTDFDVDFE